MSDLTRLSSTDALARELWAEVGRHLGVAITTTLNLFNPSAVLIGGQMAAAGEPLLGAVRQVVQERAMQVNRGNVSITASTLGQDIGVLGAGVMALELLFSPAGIGQLTRVSLNSVAVNGAALKDGGFPRNSAALGNSAAPENSLSLPNGVSPQQGVSLQNSFPGPALARVEADHGGSRAPPVLPKSRPAVPALSSTPGPTSVSRVQTRSVSPILSLTEDFS